MVKKTSVFASSSDTRTPRPMMLRLDQTAWEIDLSRRRTSEGLREVGACTGLDREHYRAGGLARLEVAVCLLGILQRIGVIDLDLNDALAYHVQ